VTVVAQDPAELGRQAAYLLFRRIDGDSAPPRRIVVPTRLMRRGSGELSPFAPTPRTTNVLVI
jgi:LacI family transcriptional regulator